MYYNSVKVVIENWCCAQEGDLTALRLNVKKGTPKKDKLAFESILDDYMRVFGMSDQFATIMKLREKLAKLQIAYLKDITGKRYLLSDMRIVERQIEEFMKAQGESVSHRKIVARLKKNGATIDMTKDTLEMVENMIRDGQ